MQRGRRRQRPQDDGEGAERHDRIQQAEPDRQDAHAVRSAVDEQPDVLGDTLVGVVGGVAQKLHAIVIGAGQPVIQICPRHPAPPADLQPLIEIELIDGEQDEGPRQHAKITELIDEGVPIPVLQGVVEFVVPLVDQNGDADDRQFDGDHRGEQDAAGPALFGAEIGAGQSPDDGERRDDASHGETPVLSGHGLNAPKWPASAPRSVLRRMRCAINNWYLVGDLRRK